MTDDGFDTMTNAKGEHRWTWTSPNGAEHVGPKFYRSRAAALKAGREWLAEREKK
jgi:hypothetical protein